MTSSLVRAPHTLNPDEIAYVQAMPKVELHVHLEGSMPPDLLLTLSEKYSQSLPATDVEGLREWFTFRDFPHFVQIYIAIANTLKSPDDLELLTRAFLQDRADQNILYSEVTYTAYTQTQRHGIPLDEQLDAVNRARAWGEAELGVSMQLIVDIARDSSTPAEGLILADWVTSQRDNGIAALGLGGYELPFPAAMFRESFALARERNFPCVLHAGETAGPESIWGALEHGQPVRIGHGVRCLEDARLVSHLRQQQIPLEVCPTSNVCLRVVPSLEAHPLPRLIDAGLYVTLNSDDPPLFNATLTQEHIACAEMFGFSLARLEQFSRDAARVALLPPDRRAALESRLDAGYQVLRQQFGISADAVETQDIG